MMSEKEIVDPWTVEHSSSSSPCGHGDSGIDIEAWDTTCSSAVETFDRACSVHGDSDMDVCHNRLADPAAELEDGSIHVCDVDRHSAGSMCTGDGVHGSADNGATADNAIAHASCDDCSSSCGKPPSLPVHVCDSCHTVCDNCHTLCDHASTDSTCTCNSVDMLCDETFTDGADISCDKNVNTGSGACRFTASETQPVKDSTEQLEIFNIMPKELTMKIFSYLTPQELSLHVAPVCRKWWELSHEPLLWQTLNISRHLSVCSLHLCQIVKHSPLLKSLNLQGRGEISMAEVSVLTDFCPLLEELDVGFCDGLSFHVLEFFVEKCPRLRSVNVEGCRIFDGKFVEVLAQAPSLDRLNLSHCIALIDSDLIHLSEGLRRITHLNIDGISWITDISVIAVVQKHKDWLTSLILDGDQISDSSIEVVAECRNLRKLSVSYSDLLTDASLGFIKDLRELRYLKLKRGTDFTVTGICDLFSSASLSKLTNLDLSECSNLNDDGVLSAVKCCGQSLRSLSLCWCCDVMDDGLTAIIDHCSSLTYLSLLGVCRAEGHSLDRIPEEIPYLKFLDLQQCNRINDDLIVEIVRRKRELRVLNYYGEMFIHNNASYSVPVNAPTIVIRDHQKMMQLAYFDKSSQ